MRYNASPITSTAALSAKAAANAAFDGDERAAESFTAILGALVMKPVEEAMGPMGAFFGDAVARAALQRSLDDPA